jgi:excisionase family DNA binding protein
MNSPLVYTVAEACAVARASRTAIYAAIGEGALTARKRGRKTLILAEDLRRWVGGLPAIKPKSGPRTPGTVGRRIGQPPVTTDGGKPTHRDPGDVTQHRSFKDLQLQTGAKAHESKTLSEGLATRDCLPEPNSGGPGGTVSETGAEVQRNACQSYDASTAGPANTNRDQCVIDDDSERTLVRRASRRPRAVASRARKRREARPRADGERASRRAFCRTARSQPYDQAKRRQADRGSPTAARKRRSA